MGADDPVLIQQGQAAFHFQNTLNNEHHIGTARIVFVKHQSAGVLQSPGQHSFAEFGDLLAVLQDDGVLADQIDAADMAIQIDANARPIKTGRHLFDMGGFTGTVIALHHDPPVKGEAGQHRQRRIVVETIGGIHIGDVLAAL